MLLNYPDIDAMPYDIPVRDEATGDVYVKKFVKDAEVTVKVTHRLKRKPAVIQLAWSDVPVIWQEDTDADGATRSNDTDAFLTFFEDKVNVLMRFA
jgi:hypothetical protein